MAVTEVNLLFTSRGGKDTFDKHRTYTRVYEVLTDDPDDDEQLVGNASAGGVSVPVLGESLPGDSDAVVVGLECAQHDDSPMIWLVTIEYDTDPPLPARDRPEQRVDVDGNRIEKADRPAQANPLAEPAQWTLTTQDSEEPATEGILVNLAGELVFPNPTAWAASTAYERGANVVNNGNVYQCAVAGTSAGGGGPDGGAEAGFITDGSATWLFYADYTASQSDPNYAVRRAILTSGGLPFDPPPTVEVSRVVLSVTKNMPITSVDFLLSLKNAVNLTTWRNAPPRCAKILKLEHDGGKESNGIQYVTTKWEIGLDPDTWDVRVLDAGYGRIVTYVDESIAVPEEVTDYERFTDRNGEPLDQPVPLNGNGQPLEPGAEPVFLRFVPRQQKIVDFNSVLPF